MGNEMSQEEEAFLEEAYKMSLDNPDVDKKVNAGTTAPNHQPLREDSSSDEEKNAGQREHGEGVELVMSEDSNDPDMRIPDDGSSAPMAKGNRRTKPKGKEDNKASEGRRSKESSRRESDRDREQQKKLSYIQMAKIGYQELVNAIIRPPRADYKVETLGPPAFTFCGRRFTRTDFSLKTKRGLNLQCSHWEPVERVSDRIPCVIYMHGNSSARVEVIPQLSYLLSLGLAVFSFDFAGSGKSDGEYVSLGYYEREDLMCVIAHLRATNVVSTIALWGRSMGAATALMHGDRDPSIACMILDSSFADLTQLAEEMVEKGREQGINVPNFVVSVAIRMIRSSVQKQANFNIRHISPIEHADKCFIPALFVAGEHDDFIHKRHSKAIHDRYAGDKNLIVVEGDHNSPRPKFMFDSVSIFLQTCLQIPNSWALKVHPGMNLMAPPWFYPGVVQNSLTKRVNIRDRANEQRNKKPGSNRNSAQSQQDMGMTAERQREIQASLFKMLGQSDDANANESAGTNASSPPLTQQNQAPSSNGTASIGNRSHSHSSSVNHAKTFPPPDAQKASAHGPALGVLSTQDEDEDDEEEEDAWGEHNAQKTNKGNDLQQNSLH
mmetsp:Transcript_14670/g.21693  ORF Transcript_14670/g.21693 Transcript_14670/m.21693 type:complete len:608 (-) Transcript_14670:132-1955(-)|eukprot:CAMPEP_0195520064 /NCGR_PEP_ID=MMETSP0794_2-20130614/16039_1 /TAXON_ID=515487 /ORGANISM="Stephanopyxis turris, Strain CCMP 815" /LENGTH=607 /DNA_ID=CAMNT_0040649337 /DNA_START=129 /DNA_END=1952 /DNA_ORIENTATION=-